VAVEQKNFQLYTYVDDNGVSWNKRGEADAIRNAVDGNAAFGAHPNWGRSSRRHSARHIVYQDATTFRTKNVLFYTGAAYNAITVGTSTLTFFIEGEVAGVVYTAVKKVPERQPAAAAARQLAEHA
jgi:hypothetical protein